MKFHISYSIGIKSGLAKIGKNNWFRNKLLTGVYTATTITYFSKLFTTKFTHKWVQCKIERTNVKGDFT